MSDPLWTAAKLVSWAVIVAVGVAFPGWPVYGALFLILGGYVWLFRVNMRAIDEWYERADRDV